ncbi:hypothetical protein L9F63_017705 [Diploptera punctata]|uniref:PIH1D1/2/3 CS-like domain-containing protein n=1 Tax=Diploptera punctata TaxID=6984 RepID=A0AAD7ZY10_DIPPU|nr:hypothetical protein L9F63_017705 [Diploptera punctata]
MAFDVGDIKKLSELLVPPEESDSEDDLPQSGLRKMGPGDISSSKAVAENPKEDSDDIWHDAEVPENVVHRVECDPRERPEYEITYKQNVTAEDIFLQMSGKTQSTTSCEDMIVTVKLPGEAYADVNVTTTEQHHLDVRSPHYYLSLDLPHPVNTNSSKAEWISEQSALKVTLRMEREFDFLNF